MYFDLTLSHFWLLEVTETRGGLCCVEESKHSTWLIVLRSNREPHIGLV